MSEFNGFPIPRSELSTVASAVKLALGLDQVANTPDANKIVSTLTQTELNKKADLASPTFTGTVGGITKTMVGLANVNDTTDANKPISTLTQEALDDKQDSDTAVTSVRPDANHLEASTFFISNILAIYNTAYNLLAGIDPPSEIDNTDEETLYLILEDPIADPPADP